MNNKKAFTLAELLISMAIIGVISVLMVPVFNSTQKKALEVGTAHFHSMMSQAIKHYMVDNEIETLSDAPMFYKDYVYDEETAEENTVAEQKAYDELNDFFYKYLKVKKVCSNLKFGVDNECFPTRISNINEDVDNLIYITDRAYVLDNGVVLSMKPPTHGRPATLQVDINGKKGPNTVGRDIWSMSVYADGVVSEHLHMYTMKKRFRQDPDEMARRIKRIANMRFAYFCSDLYGSGTWRYGAGCFARFENNGFKFDY